MYIVENHMQGRECREDYHSAVMDKDHAAMMLKVMQGHWRMISKCCLHSCPGEKEIWTKLGKRGSLTGIVCFHRAAQAELLLFHEEILKEQKETGTAAALCEPPLCPVPLPATALSFATLGGRQRGQAASSDCWQTSHIQRWDTERPAQTSYKDRKGEPLPGASKRNPSKAVVLQVGAGKELTASVRQGSRGREW